MKSFLFALVAVIAMTGCTKASTSAAECAVETSISGLVAQQVAAQLSCSNSAQVAADLLVQVEKVKNVCSAATPTPAPAGVVVAQSAVGNAVCPLVITTLMSTALSQIPSSWGCTGGTVTADVQAKILAACEKAI